MKKLALVLSFILTSTIGYAQNKSENNIDAAFLRRFPSINRDLPNPEKNPLLDEINKLEIEYLNLKAKKVHAEFTNNDLTKLKTQDEFFRKYIAHLKKKIAEEEHNATNANTSRRSQPINGGFK